MINEKDYNFSFQTGFTPGMFDEKGAFRPPSSIHLHTRPEQLFPIKFIKLYFGALLISSYKDCKILATVTGHAR